MKPKLPQSPPLTRLGSLAAAITCALALAPAPASATANSVPILLQQARLFAMYHDGGLPPATDQMSCNNSSFWGNMGWGEYSSISGWGGGCRLAGDAYADNSFAIGSEPWQFWITNPGDRYSGSNYRAALETPMRTDIEAAASYIRGLTPTQVLTLPNATLTISSSGAGAVNVIEIDSLVLQKTLTLQGGPTDYFFIHDTGDLKLIGGNGVNNKSIVLSGGIQGSNVIIVVDGNGGSSGGGGWEGTLIVDGTVNGAWDNADAYNSALYLLNNKLAIVSGWLLRWMPYTSYDYSDAPTSYGTTYVAGTALPIPDPNVVGKAARHKIIENGPYMGTNKPDAETDGNPTSTANGDDLLGTPDDEDGVTSSLSFIKGSSPSVNVTVHNPSTANAYLQCWIDLDNNGTFDDSDKGTSYSPANPIAPGATGTVQVTFPTVPLNAPASSYLRCRISTNQNAILKATTEQLVFGQTAGPGQVIAAPAIDPAHHGLNSSTPAFPPNNTAYDGNDSWPDGEVEDYPVTFSSAPNGLDYGDAPYNNSSITTNSYNTKLAQDGPRHVITSTLKLGTVIDAEADGQPNGTATGDDINPVTLNDEDGIPAATLPYLSNASTSATLLVNVTNGTGSAATLACWMDLNKNGIFGDVASEKKTATVNGPPTVNPVPLTFAISTPLTAGNNIYIRCRIASNSAEVANPTGFANTGEVEDYVVIVDGGSGSDTPFDFGDAPDTVTGAHPATLKELPDYETTASDVGPNHGVEASIYLGTKVPDKDTGSQQNDFATADDFDSDYATTGNDEDGVLPSGIPTINTLSTSIKLAVKGTNLTANAGVLACWIDFNRDGVFDNTTEKSTKTLTPGQTWYNYLYFTVNPATSFNTNPALKTGKTFIRCRITNDAGITAASISPTGSLLTGEVEDYEVTIYDQCTTTIPATVITALTPTDPLTQPPAGTPGYKFEFNALASGSTINTVATLSCHKTINYNLAWTVFKTTQGGSTVTPLGSSAPPIWNFSTPRDTLYVEMYQNNSSSALLACTVKDTVGKQCALDPLFVSTMRVKGKPVAEQVTMVSLTENGPLIDYNPVSKDFPWAKVTAEDDGAKLQIIVNGKIFKFKDKDLVPGIQEVQYIGSALKADGNNVVYLKATGKPGVRINVSFDQVQ